VFVLAPETKGRPLEAIRMYWENGGRWPDDAVYPADAASRPATHDSRAPARRKQR
jgi:hypothetical protein